MLGRGSSVVMEGSLRGDHITPNGPTRWRGRRAEFLVEQNKREARMTKGIRGSTLGRVPKTFLQDLDISSALCHCIISLVQTRLSPRVSQPYRPVGPSARRGGGIPA